MFKIMVDGIENSRHSPTCAAVTVGSAADAQVRLPSAAAEHLKIYPLHGSYGGCFKVTVHAADGMTHKCRTISGEMQTVQWTTDHGDWLVGTDINRWGGIGDKKSLHPRTRTPGVGPGPRRRFDDRQRPRDPGHQLLRDVRQEGHAAR